MTIAVAQMRIRAGQPRLNVETMLGMINEARQSQAQLIVFPELAVSGLLAGDLLDMGSFAEECRQAGQTIARAAQDIQVIFGNYDLYEGLPENAVFLADQGRLTRLPAAIGESLVAGAYDSFLPAEDMEPRTLTIGGKRFRVGCVLGDWSALEPPFDSSALDLVLDLSCRPLALDRAPEEPLWGCPCLSVNGYGLQNSGKTNYLFPGGSYLTDNNGTITARADWFREGLYFWELRGGELKPLPDEDTRLADGLVHGARCFMELIGAERMVIGMSGGIDSALAACVYREALGPGKVLAVSMPTRFNSSATKSLAEQMALGVDAPFAVVPVEEGSLAMKAGVEQARFRQGGEERGFSVSPLGMENIIARERCRVLAALAAAVGGVFSCNGNKAELTVGYATFYADLSGAFAAQADLWKYQVYQAAAAMQKRFPEAPLAQIAAIRPSAELSEAQSVDKGLGDPLLYPYHDYLLRSWVELGQDIAGSLAAYAAHTLEGDIGCEKGLVARLFPDRAAFIADLEYWWKMYRGLAVAKRIQAPPLLAMSSQPFGEPLDQAQGQVYFPQSYTELKGRLIKGA